MPDLLQPFTMPALVRLVKEQVTSPDFPECNWPSVFALFAGNARQFDPMFAVNVLRE